jgi:hypothetical protein
VTISVVAGQRRFFLGTDMPRMRNVALSIGGLRM